jgi:hypothetical protein
MSEHSDADRIRRMGNALWLTFALACGAILGWMDSSPGWDDTGVTVGLLLIVSAVFGALKPTWAWAAALAVGGWIPILEIPGSHKFASLAALGFALAGAFGGSLARRLLSPQAPPSPR